ARQALEEADCQRRDLRYAVVDPEARPMTLICSEVAFRPVPRFLAVLRILESGRGGRSAGLVLAVGIAPEARQRVTAADVGSCTCPVRSQDRDALVFSLEVIRVFDDRNIRRST